MEPDIRIVTVTPENVAREGFCCGKSKKKSDGYKNKMAWLKARVVLLPLSRPKRDRATRSAADPSEPNRCPIHGVYRLRPEERVR